MSLVAYGASDDSETSDVEEAETSQPTESGDANDRAFGDDGKISDEDDYVPTASRIQNSHPSSSSHVNVSSSKDVGLSRVYTPSTLNDLPAPKASTSVQGGGGGEEREDELEEEVKPKASQLADAPQPPPKKAPRQPARIVLPALRKDSDDEEDGDQKKAKKIPPTAGTSGSCSGLFALLPAPTHSTTKQTNRPLIPYTLTKRPPPPTPKTTTPTTAKPTTSDPDLLPSKKHQSAFNALTGYESDSDDDEDGESGPAPNFFSIGNQEEEEEGGRKSGQLTVGRKKAAPTVAGDKSGEGVRPSGVKAVGASAVESTSSSHSAAAVSKPAKMASESPVVSSSSMTASTSKDFSSSSSSSAASAQESSAKDDGDDDDNDEDDEVTSTVGIPQVNQDAPLNFSSSMSQQLSEGVGWGGGWSSSTTTTTPLTSPMVLPEMYAGHEMHSGASSRWQQQQYYAQEFSAEQQEQEASSSGGANELQQYMEDEQFLRISGKRKRKEEDIQIIDANVDDCVDPSDLMKGISEESSYQPHRKKENQPSMQQKRKKQITYLAFQAKERELELKNAWSQNRMTKNQARSKYGF